jgi:lipopolysaccharide biosynthesis glycosyltransferase
MIKYLYILVSDENDYYLEQALMSITSLKMRMPYAFVSLLTDDTTEKTLQDKRRNILGLVNELKVVKIDSQYKKKARSRWLKTSMRRHIEGDFLYIDCDTFICEDLNDVNNLSIDLGAVLDNHVLLHDSLGETGFRNFGKLLGFGFISDTYFNGGVILCRDIPQCYAFFDEWHRLWLKGASKVLFDQPYFNQVNFNHNNLIKEMSGIWNCQVLMGGINFLVDAKIIHIYGFKPPNRPYALYDSSFLQYVKDMGNVDDNIRNLLMHPRKHFHPTTYLLRDKETREIISSNLFSIIKHVYDLKLVKIIYKIGKNIYRKIRRKSIGE